MEKKKEKYFSTIEAAKLAGISRIAMFKRIQKKQVKAEKIGRNYAILKKDIVRDPSGAYEPLTKKDKKRVEKQVGEFVKKYRKTLQLLENSK